MKSDPQRKQKRRFHRQGVLSVALALLLLTGCGGEKEENIEASETPATITQQATIEPSAKKTYEPDPTPEPKAELEVTQATAYYFPDIEGFPMLYAAIEFKNTGSLPTVVSEVRVKFNTGAFRVDGEFTPMLANYDVLPPGQTSTLALWQVYEKEKDTLTATSPIKVEAEIDPAIYDSSNDDKRLYVSDLKLIQNYPLFATLSGKVSNFSHESDYALSLVYVSFYDDSDNLVGVWHFTKNLAIPSDSSRNFVMHLQSLPIPDLSKNATKIVARGIGID